MRKIVAGNWKMNLSTKEVQILLEQLNSMRKDIPNDVEWIVFPPFVYSHLAAASGLPFGAQNCAQFGNGAYTGEVSAAMLADIGARYVLIGHSERRAYFQENAEALRAKIEQALSAGLNVVYCFGETKEERLSERHFDVVHQQVTEVLHDFPTAKLSQLILAYEPVWAIGTGLTASPEQAGEMHQSIRTKLFELLGNNANEIPILYGGSCKPSNAAELFAQAHVNGGLIGGASLSANDFSAISKSF